MKEPRLTKIKLVLSSSEVERSNDRIDESGVCERRTSSRDQRRKERQKETSSFRARGMRVLTLTDDLVEL